MALHDKIIPISMSYHPSATKVICEELHSHPSLTEWTRPFCVLPAAQCPLQMSPITQPRVRHIHTAVPVPQCLTYSLQSCCEVIFFWKSLLHFCKFLVNANFDLVTKYIFKTSFNNNSVDILSVWKYCQLFTHESITFLFLKYTQKRHSNQTGENSPKPPFPLGDVNPI